MNTIITYYVGKEILLGVFLKRASATYFRINMKKKLVSLEYFGYFMVISMPRG